MMRAMLLAALMSRSSTSRPFAGPGQWLHTFWRRSRCLWGVHRITQASHAERKERERASLEIVSETLGTRAHRADLQPPDVSGSIAASHTTHVENTHDRGVVLVDGEGADAAEVRHPLPPPLRRNRGGESRHVVAYGGCAEPDDDSRRMRLMLEAPRPATPEDPSVGAFIPRGKDRT